MSNYDHYTEPTASDMAEYIAMCEAVDMEPTRAGWVATLTQNMTNNDTNRMAAACAELWPGAWPGRMP
jgi:hypothetical protein